jgi:hypothetical protein
MKRAQQLVAVVLTALVLSTTVVAQEPAPIVRSHNPRLAATAALLNIGYVPLRMMVTLVDGLLGGFVGFITFGDKAAAESIWALTSGPQVITPEMLEGTERWHMGEYD